MKYLEGRIGWGLLVLAGIAFPYLVPSDYPITVMSIAYIYALATIGLNLITGYTGQFNLAHSGFMAVGAYTVAILTTKHGVPFWYALALAGLITALVGLPLGFVSLRLKGHYFSIFTLCVGYIMYLIILKWESLTNGDVGIFGLPPIPGFSGYVFTSPTALYYLLFGFLVVGMFVMHRIVTSLLGRTFMAIRNSDELAESLGINLSRNKLLSFLLSVFYAGIAGGLYAGYQRVIGPDLAGVHHTFDMTMFMLVGGIGTMLGPLLGSLGVPWITQLLQGLQEYRFLVFGPILILLVIFVPRGIVGSYLFMKARRVSAAAKRTKSVATASAADPQGGTHHA